MRRVVVVLVLGLVAPALAPSPEAAEPGFKVVVASANPVAAIARVELAKIFLKSVTRWKDGRRDRADRPVGPVVRAGRVHPRSPRDGGHGPHVGRGVLLATAGPLLGPGRAAGRSRASDAEVRGVRGGEHPAPSATSAATADTDRRHGRRAVGNERSAEPTMSIQKDPFTLAAAVACALLAAGAAGAQGPARPPPVPRVPQPGLHEVVGQRLRRGEDLRPGSVRHDGGRAST